jgi:hypothetical protein
MWTSDFKFLLDRVPKGLKLKFHSSVSANLFYFRICTVSPTKLLKNHNPYIRRVQSSGIQHRAVRWKLTVILKKAEQESSMKQIASTAYCLLHAGFLFVLFFGSEDGDNMFLRNVRWFSSEYTALYPRRTLHNDRCENLILHTLHKSSHLLAGNNWATDPPYLYLPSSRPDLLGD